MNLKTIGFIGGGRITKVFLQGFKNKNIVFPSIKVYDTNSSILHELKKKFPEIEISDSEDDVASQEVIFIALHPPVIGESMSGLKDKTDANTLFISLAPKFTIEKLSTLLNNKRIVRVIPNATSYTNDGYNPVCFSGEIENDEKISVLETLKVLGKTFETEENKLEAYAISSAMLPTYFWFQWNEMQSISGKMGLTDEESREAIYESLKASLELMYNSKLSYTEVTDLIPVKPIGENEAEIKNILNSKLLGLYDKIKP